MRGVDLSDLFNICFERNWVLKVLNKSSERGNFDKNLKNIGNFGVGWSKTTHQIHDTLFCFNWLLTAFTFIVKHSLTIATFMFFADSDITDIHID